MIRLRTTRLLCAVLGFALTSAACDDDDTAGAIDTTGADVTQADGASTDTPSVDGVGSPDIPDTRPDAADTATPATDACGRPVRGPDADRTVVFARPYGPGVQQASLVGSAVLGGDGMITVGAEDVTLGRAAFGTIRFLHGGAIGVLATDRGDLGVFEVTAPGALRVIAADLSLPFNASTLTVGADDATLYVVDTNWPDNGGGVYPITVACDGTLTPGARILAGKNAGHLAWTDAANRVGVLSSRAAAGVEDGSDLHLVDLSDGTRAAGASAFTADAVYSALAVISDGSRALVGENSAFSGVPNRVSVIALGGASPTYLTTFEQPDPFGLVASPLDGRLLLLSGDGGDRLLELVPDDSDGLGSYDIGDSLVSPLPTVAVAITRGALTGHVIVSQNTGLRRVSFKPGGGLIDHGLSPLGDGNPGVPGALGVQP